MTQTIRINEKLLDEAEAWIVRLRSDRVTQEDKKQFSLWLNTSHDHIIAFDHASAVWETLGAVASLPEVCELEEKARKSHHRTPTNTQNNSQSNIAYLDAHKNAKRRAADQMGEQQSHNTPKISWWQGMALASCYALIALAFTYFSPLSNNATQTFETAAGEFLSVDLEDGSILELNTRTTVVVNFKDDKREISLLKGEAYFAVEPDKSRPFVVDVGNGSITAVGTAFNIRRDPDLTAVTVTEGIVDVETNRDAEPVVRDKRRVTVNQQVRLGERGIGPVKTISSDRTVAWRDKALVFNDTELTIALEELNRYLDTPVVADERLADVRISGTFSLSHPNDTLDAIVTSFNLVKVKSSTANYLYPND